MKVHLRELFTDVEPGVRGALPVGQHLGSLMVSMTVSSPCPNYCIVGFLWT